MIFDTIACMNQEILDYIKTQRVGVLAVEKLDGAPHAATVHFAHIEEPLMFFFESHRTSIKMQSVLQKPSVRASFVIGSDERNMKTLQLDGEVKLLKPEQKELFDAAYLGKFGEKKAKMADPKFVFYTFTPTWWRFTDWTKPEGKLILLSN